ncbi:hypothetical protein NPA11_00565 [Mycoplasma sp. 1578d]|uniref:hypothetical protein n=1 Tax=Mycoplasma sp. 1578d TaxID=2967299 RepID=UPI00211BFFA3|nr:hypothetical protein [Mycoplasma sp. 1578d]UUM19919.1 hypothetical protein NPA11_00565 [Mycoplasma sp. 1578d]
MFLIAYQDVKNNIHIINKRVVWFIIINTALVCLQFISSITIFLALKFPFTLENIRVKTSGFYFLFGGAATLPFFYFSAFKDYTSKSKIELFEQMIKNIKFDNSKLIPFYEHKQKEKTFNKIKIIKMNDIEIDIIEIIQNFPDKALQMLYFVVAGAEQNLNILELQPEQREYIYEQMNRLLGQEN